MNLFGPVFKYEMVRVARKQRLIIGRCIYILVLLAAIGVLYLMLFPHGPQSVSDFLFRTDVDRKGLAQFGFAFFCVFAMVQFFISAFITASVASVPIAEEKERKTLEFLLTTPLTDREIIFGKLGARVAQVMLLLLAGLPVLALMQFMGGVDPELLLAASIATILTSFSAAGVAAAVSVAAPSVRLATSRTLSVVFVYLLILPAMSGVLGNIGSRTFARTWPWFPDAIDLVNSGNPFWMATRLGRSLAFAGRFDDILPGLFLQYCGFHLIVVIITGFWSALRFRKSIARQADVRSSATAKKEKKDALSGRKRRAVFETMPVLWRETCTAVARPNQKVWMKWLGWIAFLVFFAPIGISVYVALFVPNPYRHEEDIHNMVRVAGSIAMVMSLLHLANVAGSSIVRDRRQKTFDDLALTDLSNREMLAQKGLAALWSVRWYWVWIGVHWMVDLAFGSMAIVAPILVLAAYSVFAATSISAGLRLAVSAPAKSQPGSGAMGALIALSSVPSTLALGVILWTDSVAIQKMVGSFALGSWPPTALGALAFDADDLANAGNAPFILPLLVGIGLSLFSSVLLAWKLWRGSLRRMALERTE